MGALRPELVVQVAYAHAGDRFDTQHSFVRWRSDKRPRDCTFEQLEVVPPHELRQFCHRSLVAAARTMSSGHIPCELLGGPTAAKRGV